MIAIVTPARHIALTTLAQVKGDLELTDVNPVRDAWLEDRIDDASRAIAEELDRPLVRQEVSEKFGGLGRTEIVLEMTPLAQLTALVHRDNGPVDLALEVGLETIKITDADAGLLWREIGWPDDSPVRVWLQPETVPQRGREPWTAQYLGGWLTRPDDILASGVDVAGQAFTLPAGNVTPLVAPGDVISTRGFSEPENNGRFVVTARTALAISVDADLAAETAGADATIAVRNLPSELERLTVESVKTWYHARRRDPTIAAERLGDWSATYGGGGAGGELISTSLPAFVLKGLDRYRRLM